MTYDQIVSLLGYASDNELPVRIVMTDKNVVLGVPTAVDGDPVGHEVYVSPAGAEDTEIVVSLTAIEAVELVGA